MTNARALLLLPVATCLLALSSLDAPLSTALGLADVSSDLVVRVEPLLTAASAAAGFVLVVVSLAGMYGNYVAEQRAAPYLAVLRPLAAEFGRKVESRPGGVVEFESIRDGQRVSLALDPRPGGRLTLHSAVPARQSLGWLRLGEPLPVEAAQWRDVEATDGWRLCAELPVMARPLLADGELVSRVDELVRAGGGYALHTVRGMEFSTATPPPDRAAAVARACVELAFRLRRVNG